MKSLYSLMLFLLLSVGVQAQFVTGVASVPAPTTATVNWNTCAQAGSAVKYGTTVSYGSTTSAAGLSTAHTVQLTGLLPQTTYHFATVSTDSDGNAIQSADQSFTTPVPPAAPAPSLSSQPINPTIATTAVFGFSDIQAGVTFLCGLDGVSPVPCVSGVSYTGLAIGNHSFLVEAKDSFGTLSPTALYAWTINLPPPPPTPTISSGPSNPSAVANASFTFSDTQAGVTFQCALDGGPLSSCASGVSYTALANGSHTFSVLAADPATALLSTVASFIWVVNVAAPPPPPTVFSLWTTQVPTTKDAGSDNSVELGVKVTSDVAGQITAIKFYKSPANTGTHIANVWSSTGTKLATVTFTGETASGWQRQALPTPVNVVAGTTYVVSYHSTIGHYAADANFFTAQFNNVPLHALLANGVFAYGSTAVFPNTSFNKTNYWVDFELTTSTVVCNPPNTIVNGVCTPPVAPQHTVTLNWDPSITPSVVYDVYRSAGGAFSLLASSIAGLTYVDSTVASGQTYNYAATSIGTGESVQSNIVTAIIP